MDPDWTLNLTQVQAYYHYALSLIHPDKCDHSLACLSTQVLVRAYEILIDPQREHLYRLYGLEVVGFPFEMSEVYEAMIFVGDRVSQANGAFDRSTRPLSQQRPPREYLCPGLHRFSSSCQPALPRESRPSAASASPLPVPRRRRSRPVSPRRLGLPRSSSNAQECRAQTPPRASLIDSGNETALSFSTPLCVDLTSAWTDEDTNEASPAAGSSFTPPLLSSPPDDHRSSVAAFEEEIELSPTISSKEHDVNIDVTPPPFLSPGQFNDPPPPTGDGYGRFSDLPSPPFVPSPPPPSPLRPQSVSSRLPLRAKRITKHQDRVRVDRFSGLSVDIVRFWVVYSDIVEGWEPLSTALEHPDALRVYLLSVKSHSNRKFFNLCKKYPSLCDLFC